MITRVLLEYLPLGGLPVYDVEWIPNYDIEGWGLFHVLEFSDPLAQYEMDGQWQMIPARPRIIIPLNIDANLIECQRQVPRWIETAQQFPGDGTLIFCIRTSGPVAGTDEHYVCAGLAYVPQQLATAAILDGEDPAELVLHVLQGNGDHPLVQAVLARRDLENENNRRYWQMAEAARAIERKAGHVAFKRAARLLNGCLTPKQRRELRKKQYIQVTGQDGQLYRIEERGHQNVFLIQEGVPVFQYCVVSREKIPVPDLMLAQKLMLESSLEDFMKLANKWDLREVERVGRRARVIPANYWDNPANFPMVAPNDLERILAPEVGVVQWQPDVEIDREGNVMLRGRRADIEPVEQLDVAV